MENILVACYHIDKEKTLIELVIKESHGVCTTEIFTLIKRVKLVS